VPSGYLLFITSAFTSHISLSAGGGDTSVSGLRVDGENYIVAVYHSITVKYQGEMSISPRLPILIHEDSNLVVTNSHANTRTFAGFTGFIVRKEEFYR
jgi:hypothetical protein